MNGLFPDSLWARIDKVHPNGCWEWTGPMFPTGYGIAYDPEQKRSVGVHRIVYRLLVGSVPTGLELDHLCRNRRCVNPEHLEPVTRGENIRRGALPVVNRLKWSTRTECKHGHPWPEFMSISDKGERSCRACTLDRWYRLYRKEPKGHPTHCPQGHPYDEANTRWSIPKKPSQNPSPVCRACHREKERQRKRVKR